MILKIFSSRAFSEFHFISSVLPRDQNDVTYGVFGNNTTDLAGSLALETGFRGDYSVDWGFFALPRISLLWNVNEKFSTRLGGGLGYKIPDLFTEEAAMLHYRNVLTLDKSTMEAERSYGVNLDFNYRMPLSDNLFLSVNQLFYTTYISDALLLESTPSGQYAFGNAPDNIQSLGSETNLKLSLNDFRWFLNYAFIDTRLSYLPGSPQKPLTPKHNAGTVLMYENDKWRIGYEMYYTGRQYLSSGAKTRDYLLLGLLLQRHFDWGSPYINFENFTDRRQNRFSPEVTGTVRNPVFQEIYAPTDGFVFSVGILIKPFGGESNEH